MYNKGDNTFLSQPKLMTDEVIDSLIQKVAIYCKQYDITSFDFVFHGGEPLLAGMPFIKRFIDKSKKALTPRVKCCYSLQTNGILIDDSWSRFFKENNISVGLSIDGPQEIHDTNRVYHNGKGSFTDVMAGAAQLRKHNSFGVLMVINPDITPKTFYALLKAEEFDNVNLLFPESNHDKYPFGDENYFQQRNTRIADWLIEIYKLWKEDKDARPSIFLFKQIIGLILGRNELGDELLGTKYNNVLVIETNGSIEAVDTLKVVGNGFTKTDLNILDHDLDDVLKNDLTRLYYNSHNTLCTRCRNCAIQEVCGGGMLAHRYKSQNGFNNPSVYCYDLIKIISFIQNDILNSLPAEGGKTQTRLLTFTDIIDKLNRTKHEENPSKSLLESFREYSGLALRKQYNDQ